MSRPIPRLPEFNLPTVCDLETWPPSGWESAPVIDYAQHWLPALEPAFRPAQVRLAATTDRFVVLAELSDDEIITQARQHNDPLWDLGDVFEIFLQPADRPEYFEFHIAPNGVTLDLRYPYAGASRANGVEQYMLSEPHFTAQVVTEPLLNRWRVGVEIPVAKLASPESLNTPGEWLFSFSRYDCATDREPVLSSTSPHRKVDFHQTDDWKRFTVPAFRA